MANSLKAAVGPAFVQSIQALLPAPFDPEAVKLGDYGFLPWVRTGLAAAIKGGLDGNRAQVTVSVDVEDSNDATQRKTVSRTLTLYGPGDVAAIDPDQIIRREPAPGTVDAEESFVAHVEFARPDFPWLFSPFEAKDGQCRPWLALVVVEARLSSIEPSKGALPPRLWTRKGQLQSLAPNAHFAHAQVVGAALQGDGLSQRGAAADTVETRLSDDHAAANLSRILCPRRLAARTDYIAALVPALDCGVKAATGINGGTLSDAWTREAGDEDTLIDLPVYDYWQFSTAPGGNFQQLAERIKGRPAPWRVGRRDIDLSQPGGRIPTLRPGDAAGVQLLECALISPAPAPADRAAPLAWPTAHREALRQRLDEANATNPGLPPDLPRVGARLYARYQRAASRIGEVFGKAPFAPDATASADSDWFSQLNTSPMLRLIAGLGAKVVQKDQEPLMQAAWLQIEGLRKANQAVIWAGFAEVVTASLNRRHLVPLDVGRLAQVTRNLHPHTLEPGRQRSLASAVSESRTAAASLEPAFRRALRPQGAVGRRLGLATTGRFVADAAGFVDQRRKITIPDGIIGLSPAGERVLTPELIARELGVTVAKASATLQARLRPLAAGSSVRRLQQKTWAGPSRGAVGDLMGSMVLETVTRTAPGRQTKGNASAGPLAELALGFSLSGGGLANKGKTKLKDFSDLAPKADLSPLKFREKAQDPVDLRRRGGTVIIGDTPRKLKVETKPELRFETAFARQIAKDIAQLNQRGMTSVRADLAKIVTGITLPPPSRIDPGALSLTRASILAATEPHRNARLAFTGRIQIATDRIPARWIDIHGLRPIMAAPEFLRPMYQALEDYDRDWLVPGLGLIPDPDFITLLQVSSSFPEAFLIGASDEMGRELLWRDFPTDQRGTCFRRFWDAAEDELTADIHRFSRRPIGSHFRIGGTGGAGRATDPLAVVIKGELLRRFPETAVVVLRAKDGPDGPIFGEHDLDPVTSQPMEARILFHAQLKPDYTVIGVDLTLAEVLDPARNWWIILAQNPTAPRFGFASADGKPLTGTSSDRDDLDWDDLPGMSPAGFLTPAGNITVRDDESKPTTVRWPGNAAVTARVMLKNPIRAAFRASDLIGRIASGS